MLSTKILERGFVMKNVLCALFFTMLLSTTASAATINVTFGDRQVELDLNKICKKQAVSRNGYQLPVRLYTDGSLHVGTEVFPKGTCGRKFTGVGGGTASAQQGVNTGQTATEIAVDTYHVDPDLVGPIDSVAVGATGDGQEIGDTVTGEGLTQSDMTDGATDTPPAP